ncbi:AGAP007579-PA-like protein [Anopheles sinensis]|uniref:Folliculin n=1 Tax=Anopheles sinensis TaxID=74873 RepID=A0A084VI07_ANOSI|nr:AGAP007579-PA-like protein [Anopheles sinensis]
MNAIIALCHFCEIHGPGAILCTQTLRETNIEQLDISFDTERKGCVACNSIGNNIGLVSRDPESNANFVSSQMPVLMETASLVKTAAFRSLSSEVSCTTTEGGFVFFGDAKHGHVLSHTFHLIDSEARGFQKRFSIVIIMKDKMFLLNTQPFLADCMSKVSKELQDFAKLVHEDDLRRQGLDRAKRINKCYGTGSTNNAANITANRSLIELTGKESIYAYVHAHFSFILWAGARYLTENFTLGCPSTPVWLGKETEEGFALVQSDKEGYQMRRHGIGNGDRSFEQIDECTRAKYSLRMFRTVLKSHFLSVCYCALTGIQIVIRGTPIKGYCLVANLKKFLPEALHKLARAHAETYTSANEFRIINLKQEAIAPHSSSSIMRVDLVDDYDRDTVAVCAWDGELPSKLPSLLQKIMKAMDEELFNDEALDKHLRLLIEEWKNKVVCIRKVSSNQDVVKIKKILGIQPQDQVLINYWYNHL